MCVKEQKHKKRVFATWKTLYVDLPLAVLQTEPGNKVSAYIQFLYVWMCRYRRGIHLPLNVLQEQCMWQNQTIPLRWPKAANLLSVRLFLFLFINDKLWCLFIVYDKADKSEKNAGEGRKAESMNLLQLRNKWKHVSVEKCSKASGPGIWPNGVLSDVKCNANWKNRKN